MRRPVVSVVMPVLNAAPFLPEAIDSILQQTLDDFELLIVDDGSDDGSQEVAAAFAERDARVRYIELARDPGIASGARASNVGLDAAEGAYIARMDADDIAAPDRLAVQVEALEADGLDVCGGMASRFGDREGMPWQPETHDAIAAELVFRAGFPNATMLARAEVLKAARFSETEAYEEYELQTRLIWDARLGVVQREVLRVRFHPGQTTRVLNPMKARSHWRSRFRYFFRRFPEASLDDFQCVNRVARRQALGGPEDLALAGRWLVRLSRHPDEKLRARMARRWREACDSFFGEDARPAVHASVEAEILAAP